ncbi:hypothetical protein FV139_13250 [Parahaliea maris]|uniref:Uncharacterized protein n=1 Tax=Parahaliea maris TaxID=2716870 RepID=A0A5C9A0H9_9GAMM|nr:hypothetical protein [Parahaliea maris]TXS92921.1 hypothetical protein FV139_13250 [Parahaliea maris]
MANEILLTAAENDQLSQVLEKGNQDISSLTGAEFQQYWGYNYALMNSLDAAHGFYKKGILGEDDYAGWRTYTCQYLRGPSVREIWNNDKATFGDDFAAFVTRECNL